MNKIIIGISAAVLAFVGLVWFAQPKLAQEGAPQSKGNSELVVADSNAYDFGSISMAKGKVRYTFRVKNTAAEPIALSKAYTSCMCTTATITAGGASFGPFGMPGHGALSRLNKTLAPEEEMSVEVEFDPAAHGPAGVGRISRTVTIEPAKGERVQLAFSAVVTP